MRLAVCSSKGGVGKTATAANLAAVLGQRGPTLAVDADPQDSLGRAFAVVAGEGRDSLAGLLTEDGPPIDDVIRRDAAPGVDVLPAHPSLERVGVQLAQEGGLASSLRRALRPVAADYDHMVIDTHGDMGNLTLAAVAAAEAVLTVFTSDPGSALGAVRLSTFLEQHRRFENTSAVLLGVACANWDKQGRRPARSRQRSREPAWPCSTPRSRSHGAWPAPPWPSARSSSPRPTPRLPRPTGNSPTKYSPATPRPPSRPDAPAVAKSEPRRRV